MHPSLNIRDIQQIDEEIVAAIADETWAIVNCRLSGLFVDVFASYDPTRASSDDLE